MLNSSVRINLEYILPRLTLLLCLFFGHVATSVAAIPLTAMTTEEATQELEADLPQDLTREEVRDLLARLSDDQVRAVLLAQLDRVAAANADTSEMPPENLHNRIERVSGIFSDVLTSGPELSSAPRALWSHVTQDGAESGIMILFWYVILFVAAWVVEHFFRRATRSVGEQPPTATDDTFASRCGLLILRAVVQAIGVVVFALVAIGGMCLVMLDNDGASDVFMLLLGPILAVRFTTVISRAVFAPYASSLRVLPLSDAAARAVHVRVIVFATAWFLMPIPLELLRDLRFPFEATMFVNLLTGAAVVAVIMVMIWQARRPVAELIRGGKGLEVEGAGGFLNSLARNWHLLASVYLLMVWVFAVFNRLDTGEDQTARAFLSLLLIVIVPVADAGLKKLVARFFAPEEPEPAPKAVGADVVDISGDEEIETLRSEIDHQAEREAARARAAKYQAAMLRNLRILLAIAIVIVFAEIWSIDIADFAQKTVGARITGALFDIGITVLLAYAVWSVVKVSVERHAGGDADAGAGAPGEGDMGGGGASRIVTLLPLLRKFVAITLIVMVVMIGLSALGVNVGPLLAGAGMLGIAIGFGAQTLVRDVISGLFFLLDDAFRMGEYVEIDNIRGTVERISVRSLQLRHHNGPVHTLPFGEIRHLTNYSRDYAIMKFEIRLPFETDINKVRKIIKKTGIELMEDPDYGHALLAPLKSQGVNRMDDSALIVRCKFTSKPGEQFVLRREAYTRIQKALAEADIHFAPRRVIVETASPNVPPEALKAAAGSIDTEQPATGAKADDRG